MAPVVHRLIRTNEGITVDSAKIYPAQAPKGFSHRMIVALSDSLFLERIGVSGHALVFALLRLQALNFLKQLGVVYLNNRLNMVVVLQCHLKVKQMLVTPITGETFGDILV